MRRSGPFDAGWSEHRTHRGGAADAPIGRWSDPGRRWFVADGTPSPPPRRPTVAGGVATAYRNSGAHPSPPDVIPQHIRRAARAPGAGAHPERRHAHARSRLTVPAARTPDGPIARLVMLAGVIWRSLGRRVSSGGVSSVSSEDGRRDRSPTSRGRGCQRLGCAGVVAEFEGGSSLTTIGAGSRFRCPARASQPSPWFGTLMEQRSVRGQSNRPLGRRSSGRG